MMFSSPMQPAMASGKACRCSAAACQSHRAAQNIKCRHPSSLCPAACFSGGADKTRQGPMTCIPFANEKKPREGTSLTAILSHAAGAQCRKPAPPPPPGAKEALRGHSLLSAQAETLAGRSKQRHNSARGDADVTTAGILLQHGSSKPKQREGCSADVPPGASQMGREAVRSFPIWKSQHAWISRWISHPHDRFLHVEHGSFQLPGWRLVCRLDAAPTKDGTCLMRSPCPDPVKPRLAPMRDGTRPACWASLRAGKSRRFACEQAGLEAHGPTDCS